MFSGRSSRFLVPFLFLALARASSQQFPVDSRVIAELETPISSKDAVAGQAIELKVLEAVVAKDRTVLMPVGAKLFGKVTHVVRSKPEDPTGEISFRVERAQWKDHDMELHAYPVTMAMPLVLKDETPDDPQLNTGQIYNAPIAVTRSAQSAVSKQIAKRAQDPSAGRREEERKLTLSSQPLPQNWGMVRAEEKEIFTIIGSNTRDISLPKRMRFVLREVENKP